MTSLLVENNFGYDTDNLRLLFENSELGFFVVNNQGELTYINRAAGKIIGRDNTADDIEYDSHEIESILNCSFREISGRLDRGQSFRKDGIRCTNRQGHYEVLNLFCSPLQNNEKKTGFLGIMEDITGFSRRQSDLEEVIKELSIMWQVSDALSSTSDLDHTLKIILTGITANQGLGFNRAFLFMTDDSGSNLEGIMAIGPGSPEEAGRIWSRLAQPEITLKTLLNNYIYEEGVMSLPLTSLIRGWKVPLADFSIFSQVLNEGNAVNVFRGENLSPLSIEILSRLNTDNMAVAPIISNGKKLGVVAADNQITGKKIAQSEVQLLQTFANHTGVAIERSRLHGDIVRHTVQLEEKNREIAASQEQIIKIEKMSVIGELTSSIAHELRNPLTVIGGFANLMLTSDRNDNQQEYLNIIVSEAKRAESVLNQVLDFSRASNSGSGEVDFNHLIRSTFDLFVSRLPHKYSCPRLNQMAGNIPVRGNFEQLQHAVYQFFNLMIEELTDNCQMAVSVKREDFEAVMTIEFNGGDDARKAARNALSQIFNSSAGTQKLSIVVAGETIKYHGGSYGVMGSAEMPPCLYMKLPVMKDCNHG